MTASKPGVPRLQSGRTTLPSVKPCRCEPKAVASADVAYESDTTLMSRIAQRDQLAINEIHLRYHGRITRFVRRWALSGELADEISNETIWIVWQSAARFRGASSVSTWILGIANNLRRKTLMRQGRIGAWQSLSCGGAYDAYEPGAQTEVSEWVALGLSRLPAEQRVIIELAYHLGYSCQEIAETVNCPVNTVKTRMFHGRLRLKRLLPELAGIQSGGAAELRTRRSPCGA
jgi:RNA polymerase sigma-70 factor (ECF subfamily)